MRFFSPEKWIFSRELKIFSRVKGCPPKGKSHFLERKRLFPEKKSFFPEEKGFSPEEKSFSPEEKSFSLREKRFFPEGKGGHSGLDIRAGRAVSKAKFRRHCEEERRSNRRSRKPEAIRMKPRHCEVRSNRRNGKPKQSLPDLVIASYLPMTGRNAI
jgi:hypothetical protein